MSIYRNSANPRRWKMYPSKGMTVTVYAGACTGAIAAADLYRIDPLNRAWVASADKRTNYQQFKAFRPIVRPSYRIIVRYKS